LKRLGKKGWAWEKVKRQIKPKFQAAGITVCEICGGDYFLTFAHARKRRNLKKGELSVCALLCRECHDKVEIMQEKDMHRLIMEIIEDRENQPVPIPDCAWEYP
jgi:5-methylcytosine-specific restriction endonuclease McrA